MGDLTQEMLDGKIIDEDELIEVILTLIVMNNKYKTLMYTHQNACFHVRKCLLGVSMVNFHIYSLSPPKFEQNYRIEVFEMR